MFPRIAHKMFQIDFKLWSPSLQKIDYVSKIAHKKFWIDFIVTNGADLWKSYEWTSKVSISQMVQIQLLKFDKHFFNN